MTGALGRFAVSALRCRRGASAAAQHLPRAAGVHTVPDSQWGPAEEPDQVHPDMYAREEHKWDDSALEVNPRASRFPATLSVPEGAARVAMPDFPSIVRHSLAEPNYGSFGYSLRDPPYKYVPKRHASTYAVITGRMPAKAPLPAIKFDDETYQPEDHAWSTATPLPRIAGTWHKPEW